MSACKGMETSVTNKTINNHRYMAISKNVTGDGDPFLIE